MVLNGLGNTARGALLTLVAIAASTKAAWAFDPFVIKQVRAEGLQRLELGTVLTYFPLSVGDELTETASRSAIRSLYGSGLFLDVQLVRDGDDLVIKLKERPAIASFKLEGNEKVGGDELNKSLKDAGLAEGELFKRALLDSVEQELRRQYYANGYYDVAIEAKVTDLPNNRVDINIKVTEGKVTKIKEINLIGNTAFPRDELLKQLKLEKTTWMPFQKTDRYSKQQLGGDLETLSSYYQDRGYLQFNIASVQVALSPDKQDIYVTLALEEGAVYKVKDHRFSGEIVLNEKFLDALTSSKNGAIFSRKEATETATRIEGALSDIGYAFAKVTPLPEVDEPNREVRLNFFIEPGKRAYIRRINFQGHTGTNDETLRREMRQLEAAPFSKSAVERSRQRLARLPFIEEAEVETKPVPGTDDLVDIEFKVKERAPGSIQFGVGYSGAQGFLINASITNTNFLGTGNRVQLAADTSTFNRSVSLSLTDPYFTQDGISQTVSTYFRKSQSVIRFSSGFDTNVVGGDLTYGIPLSEFASLRLGGGVSQTAVKTFPGASSNEILNFVINNGTEFTAFQLRTGIARDTRNRTFFATSGMLTRLNLDITLPGISDLSYYNTSISHEQYFQLPFKFFTKFNATVGYVHAYGSSKDVPPYELYFAGGANTVRGYRDGSLGPRDFPNNNPFGGELRATSQTDLVFPIPVVSDNKTTRASLFYDFGNVYAKPGDFSVSTLRQAYGLSFSFFTPILGLLSLSYAFPLNDKPGDFTDSFQINFGTGF
ncbi:outer membrane protein assembly factor BamA [Nevskia sp.]|uniref:outer membrane protein assembly factor BamA n=1 Tax=Nevskia sp. TaxID=1929292 RepID=UPI0025DED079|nr:outer membrane protein assembly factor BamA [Nevskia sp.]